MSTDLNLVARSTARCVLAFPSAPATLLRLPVLVGRLMMQNIQSAFHFGQKISSSGRNGTSTQWGALEKWLSIFQCAKSSAPCDSPSPSLSTWPVESPAAQDAQQICMSPPGLLPQTSFIFFTLKVCKVYFQLIWGPGKLSRVASAVDIIDQLSTTFKICLCTMYIENVLDYPSQLY